MRSTTVLALPAQVRKAAKARNGTKKPRQARKREVTLFEAHVFRSWVDTQWCAVLTPSEQAVMQMVVARTLAFGKLREMILVKHAVDGIRRRSDGQLVYAGCGLGERTVRTCLATLCAEGFLTRSPHKRTYRYSVNIQTMATERDPALVRGGARAARLAEVEALRAARRRNLVEAERRWREEGTEQARQDFMAMIEDESGPIRLKQQRRTRCAKPADGWDNTGAEENPPIENTGESDEIAAKLAPRTVVNTGFNPSLRSGLKPKAGAARPEAEAKLPEPRKAREAKAPVLLREQDTAETWKDRERRVRRRVRMDDINRPVIQQAAQAAPSHPTPVPEPSAKEAHAAAGGDLASILSTAMANVGKRQKRQAGMARTVEDLEQVWARVHMAKTGRPSVAWTPKDRGRLRRALEGVPLPDPAMRWGSVLDWVAGNWGEATSLAVPFMLHAKAGEDDDDEYWTARREDLLRALPSLSLFLTYAGQYVAAYATMFHGEGFRPHDMLRAEADQRMHARFLARTEEQSRVGYDNLSAQHRTTAELDDLARKMAERGDADMQDLLAARDKWAALARQLRKDWGADWRKHLRAAMLRQERAEAMANRTPEEQAQLDAWAAQNSLGQYDPDMDDQE